MIFLNIKLWFPVCKKIKGEIGVALWSRKNNINTLVKFLRWGRCDILRYSPSLSHWLQTIIVLYNFFCWTSGFDRKRVKIGSCLCTKCHIIQGLYDNAKIVNLSGAVHDIWFWNIPLFDVIRHLMTSSWHHNFIMTSQLHYDIKYIYLNVNVKYLWSYKLVGTLQIRISLQTSFTAKLAFVVLYATWQETISGYMYTWSSVRRATRLKTTASCCIHVQCECTNDNYVWGKSRLRANWVYTIHTE